MRIFRTIFRTLLACFGVFVMFAAFSGASAEAALTPMPPDMLRSKSCEVRVNGEPLDVLSTAVNHSRKWTPNPLLSETPVALFEMDGAVDGSVERPVEIEVRFIGIPLESVTVRPLSLGIKATIDGDIARFTLDKPAQLTVEYNNQVEGALHLFALPLDTNPPDLTDPNVIYLDAGVHDIRMIEAQSGQTIYLAPGAVLRGAIHGYNAQNVRVCGRGIIDGSVFDRWADTLVPINFEHSTDITIEGITILNPSAWTLNTYFCEDVTIRNVQIVAARSNSDGITTQSCKRLTASDCFVRGWDDNLVVKGYDGDAQDIVFERCILWTDLAQSCEIGYETRADVIERVTFEDIIVLHNFHKPVMSIHNSDNALVRDVAFRNVIVEDARMGQGDGANLLIELTTTKSQWSKSKERGRIRNVLFDNVRVLSGSESSVRVFSFNKDYNIDDVTIRNLTLFGQRISNVSEIKLNGNRHNGGNIILLSED